MLSKNGIVRQNYIKSCDFIGDYAVNFLMYDSRGKEVFNNYFADILEQSAGRLVIRMQEPFDTVSSLDCK